MMRRIGLLVLWVFIAGLWMVWSFLLYDSNATLPISIRFVDQEAIVWFLLGAVVLIIGLFGVVRWPTREQRLENTKLRVTPYLSDAVLICNRSGKTLWQNRAAAGMMQNQTLKDDLQPHLSKAMKNRQLAIQMISLNGQRYSLQTVPTHSDQYALVLRLIPDTSNQNALYDNFIRRIVHDMRNPLAGIIGHATNLRYVSDQQAVDSAADTIEKEARRLARLVDSMLFDARLAYVPLNIETFDLLDVVEEAVYALEEKVFQSGKDIQVSAPPEHMPFAGDRDLLLRAIENLVDNGIKYTDATGKINIILKANRDMYEITIQDNGLGIPAEYLPDRIFQPMVRARSGGDGSGLGLSIVQKIVTMHHGTIHAVSEVNEGTQMFIQLPRQAEAI